MDNKIKQYRSKDYNFVFNKEDGTFIRWGKTPEDDPSYSPIGPEIADIEITTSCNGINGKLCKFCYKGNSPNGTFMSLETFKKVFDRLPKTLTQIAFGVDSQCSTNPDVWDIMKYCRANGVIPNVTVANIDYQTAVLLAIHCGAVAVSRYDDKNVCYDSVNLLTKCAKDGASCLRQVNIHHMISEETYDQCIETLNDKLTDPRLRELNAIVLLSLKQKGRGINHTPLGFDKFKNLVNFALNNKIGIGFDSCTAPKFLEAVRDHKQYQAFKTVSEPCESGLFSIYINVNGNFFPCSFSEDEGEWKEGISVVNCKDFLQDIWFHDRVKTWRNNLMTNIHNNHGCRECPLFKV